MKKQVSLQSSKFIFITIIISLLVAIYLTGNSLAEVQQEPTQPSFIAFESGPVRPMAMTPSGSHLIVTNIPDNRIEVFAIDASGNLTALGAIPVGMEPVAVAARTDNEVWVVNHLSDSVSVVDLTQWQVTRTLLVGDEPRDIVFAGEERNRAFITTAHRGQHRTHPSLSDVEGAGDPQLTTPSTGRADIWVFDSLDLGDTLGGTPLKIVQLFGDTPRALAVTPDGSTVYAAIFHSGNQTASVPMPVVCTGEDPTQPCEGDGITSPSGLENGMIPGGPLAPWTNYAGENAPLVGQVVKFNNENGRWEDEAGRNWSNAIRFYLPDLDVFAIDASTLEETANYAHVGTTLFNMVVNPANGKLYVSNVDAKNEVRFEGPANYADTTVQGNLAQSHITVIDPDAQLVQPRHLNKHIDYTIRPALAGVKDHSLAMPLEMVVSSDGTTLYVAAFGSSKVGLFSTAALEDGSFDPTVDSENYIKVRGGPSGLVLNERQNRLYVSTRFDNGVSVLDATTGAELSHLAIYSPEPAEHVAGRPVLYDAYNTSSNGEASCNSCHTFGDMDHLAWDLGNPDEDVTKNPISMLFEHDAERNAEAYNLNGTNNVRDFHPLKGPMLTQSLRGMGNSGAMHWRGDRSTGFFGDSGTDERLSFTNFIVAFEGLVGDDTPATDAQRQDDMNKFADFALALTYPPNPNRSLDNSLTSSQAGGSAFFHGPRRASGAPDYLDSPGEQEGATCQECHRLAPEEGFYGTGGNSTFEGLTQIVKVAQMRNFYTRIGMFGMANTWLVSDEDVSGNSHEHMGDQVRGYGFNHDGIYDTLHRFTLGNIFNATNYEETGFQNDEQRRNVEQFLLAFDSDLAPIVGQQITLDPTNGAIVQARIELLMARASTPFTSNILGSEIDGNDVRECDLVVHGSEQRQTWGMLYDPDSDTFLADKGGEAAMTNADLQAYVTEQNRTITYTCVPPGSGRRVALDRNEDGILNRDESGPMVTTTPVATVAVTETLTVQPITTAQPTATAEPVATEIPIGQRGISIFLPLVER